MDRHDRHAPEADAKWWRCIDHAHACAAGRTGERYGQGLTTARSCLCGGVQREAERGAGGEGGAEGRP